MRKEERIARKRKKGGRVIISGWENVKKKKIYKSKVNYNKDGVKKEKAQE